MPVHFYLHTALDDTKERRGLYRIASLLQQHFGFAAAPDVTLIGNIDPTTSSHLRSLSLTQLDGLVITNTCMALIELKNYPDPIDGEDPNRKWYVQGPNGRPVRVAGGKSINPLQQARKAHNRWSKALEKKSRQFIDNAQRRNEQKWRHLNGFVLFHPYLHPSSKLPRLGNNHLWLNLAGTEDIIGLLFSNRPRLTLTSADAKRLAEDVLQARPWHNLARIVTIDIGYIQIEEPSGAYSVYRLRQYDTITIGRSRHNRIIIDSQFNRVSGSHLRFETQEESVRMTDLSSTHGTTVDGQSLRHELGNTVLLGDTADITLGGDEQPGACRLVFTRHQPNLGRRPIRDKTEQTNLS